MDPLLQSLDSQFKIIHERSMSLLALVPDRKLFWKPTPTMHSCGENFLRSAAAVEQTFGGITTRLWDDPFEWTLPEELSTCEKIVEYLNEVEETRRRGFEFFTSDADLSKQIPAPEKLKTLFELLIETVARANHYQGRAFAVFQMFSDKRPPRV